MPLPLLGLLLLAPAPQPAAEAPIQMVIRVFDGTTEVTDDARVNVYVAGTRESPLAAHLQPGTGLTVGVAPGMYDAQVIRQREGKVLNIRWAERLLVIRYPDEPGEHLQVINLKPGFGALQLRPPAGAGTWPQNVQAAVYPTGDHQTEASKPIASGGYLLFVLPAGKYDLQLRRDGGMEWMNDIEVPLDRTRLRQVKAGA
jgi:hypothetical protein